MAKLRVGTIGLRFQCERICALALFWAPLAFGQAADWPMFGHDPARQGQSSARFPSATLGHEWATPPPLTLLAYQEGIPYWSSPCLATVEGEPRVFIGCYDNNVWAFDAATGQEAWRFPTAGPVSATPVYAVVEGKPMLFVASADRSIYALKPSSKLPSDADRRTWHIETMAWSQTVSPARMADPLLAQIDGRVVLFCGVWNNDRSGATNVQRGEAIALEAKSGAILWRRTLGSGAVGAPCLGSVGGEPALFVPYEPGAIFALSARDGHDLWPNAYSAGDEIHGGVSLGSVGGRQLLFFGGRTAWLSCLDAETGSLEWTKTVNTWVDSTPAFAVIDGRPTVFFGTYTYFLVACDAATGAELWRYRTRGIVQASPAVATMGEGPVVCFPSLDDHLYVLSARDGRFLYRHSLGRFPWTHYLKGKTLWSSCAVGTFGGVPLLVAPSYSGVVHAFAVNGREDNAGPPRDSFWDALGEAYTIPVLLVVAIVLALTFRRLLRARRAKPSKGDS